MARSRIKPPGKFLVRTEVWEFFIGVVLVPLTLWAKRFHPDVQWPGRLLRNYGLDLMMIMLGGSAVLIALQDLAKRERWLRPALWNRALIWVIPTIGLAVGYATEIAQFLGRYSHGDPFDLLTEALGWTITVVPLALADRADRRPRQQ